MGEMGFGFLLRKINKGCGKGVWKALIMSHFKIVVGDSYITFKLQRVKVINSIHMVWGRGC